MHLSFEKKCGPPKGADRKVRKKKKLFLLGLLGQEHSLDVGENTTLSNGDSGEKFVQFFVIANGELEMSWDDTSFLVITGSISGQFENLSGQIFHDSGEVNWGSGSNTFSVVSFAEKSVDSSNWELKPRAARASLALSLRFTSLSTTRHDDCL